MALVKYLIQGLDENQNHLNKIQEILSFDEATNIIITTAYLRFSAVELLQNDLKENKDKLTILVGIRNGATSMQALKRLYETGAKVYVVDTGRMDSIFHMKNYVSFNDKTAIAITGSANFTPSGLLRNIESSSIIKLDLNNNEDRDYLQVFVNNIKTLINEFPDNVIKIENIEYIYKLLLEGLVIDEEKEISTKSIDNNHKNENIVPKMELKIQKSSIKSIKHKIKEMPIEKEKFKEESSNYITNNKTQDFVEVWKSKALTERDLNVPSNSNKTNVTGSMLLKKGQYDVNQQTYFRQVVFNDLRWHNKKGKPIYFEYAVIEARFIIDGIDNGIRNLEIKHDKRTDTKTYKQKQPMTHLIWGQAKSLISNRHLLGKELTLYKENDTNNKYVIDIK